MKVLLLLLAVARAAPDDAPGETPVEPPPPNEPSQAQTAPEEPEEPVATEPFDVALATAKRRYFEGEHEQALELLLELRARVEEGEAVPPELYEDTMLYLGEVQFQLGDRTASWDTFEALLLGSPDASMSALEHPAEVVRWFELVRDKVEQDRVPEPAIVPPLPPPPLPIWGYAPFGIPQFATGRNARGVTYVTLQTGFAVVSIWSYVHLASINGPDHPPEWTDEEVAQKVNLQRWAIQWPATIGFYATWAISVFDARRAWRADHAPPVAIGLEPRPAGAVLVLRGRL